MSSKTIAPSMTTEIARNLQNIREQIEFAAGKSGRRADSVTVVAVSKTKSIREIETAFQAGQTHFGENYVQEFLPKRQALATLPLKWHFVGSLQRRKIKDLIGQVALIHSLDSLELAKEIDKRAQACGCVQEALVQVNLEDEKTKSGIAPDKTASFLRELSSLAFVRIRGLMILPPFYDDPEKTRPQFQQLREMKESLSGAYREPLTELSMGMSHDFSVAIEEGATLIRVGTAIFGERKKVA